MGRSIFRCVVSSFKVGRDESLVTFNNPLYAAVTKFTLLKNRATMSRLLEYDPNLESTCNIVLIGQRSYDNDYCF